MYQRLLMIQVRSAQDVILVRQSARSISRLLGFGMKEQTCISTAVSEIAGNAYMYAREGLVEFGFRRQALLQIIEITVRDFGSGIADLQRVLERRLQPEAGPVHGIIGVKRLMDSCEIKTGPAGTCVTLRKAFALEARQLSALSLAAITAQVAALAPDEPLAELQHQNRELTAALNELRERNEELKLATKSARDVAHLLRESDLKKDEFLATLAHELRSPLAPIRASVDYLRMARPRASIEIEKAQSIIARQTDQLARLVDDLLDVARITRGKLELRQEVIDLTIPIQVAAETAAPLLAQRRQILQMTLGDHPLYVRGDAVRLSQVFGNLLHNAAKFSEPCSIIRLNVDVQEATARVFVVDRGIGLAAHVLPTIFGMFVQSEQLPDRPQVGLGIGLSVVKCLVEMHGGVVQAFSEGRDKGATFVVCLPIVERRKLETGESAPVPTVARACRRVLVVDDNADAADSIAALLGMEGHQIRVAYSSGEALEEARRFAPEVVLLDIGLPGKDGYEVAREMRSQSPGEALYIAVTGYGHENDKQRAQAAGFHHHMVKPVDTGLLARLLEQHLPLRSLPAVQVAV